MRSLNKLCIIGNVGADPEMRNTTGGTHVCTLSVATTETWGDERNRQEKTEWHRVVLWQGLADIADKHIRKGDRLYIEGRVEYRQWQDKDGETRYTTEVVAKELIMLGSAAGRNASRARDDGPPPDEYDDRGESAGDYFDRKGEERRAAAARPRTAAAKGAKRTGKQANRRR